MVTFAVFVSVVLGLATIGILIQGVLSRRIDVISYHSLFLVGMVQFYFLPLALYSVYGIPETLYRPDGWGFNALAGLMPLFFITYLVCVRFGPRLGYLGRFVPRLDLPITMAGLSICYVTIVFMVVITFVLSGTSYAEALLFEVRPLLASASVGLATAMVVARPRNVFLWLLAIGTFGLMLVLSTVGGADRRMPLSVFFSAVWIVYYLWLRRTSIRTILTVGGIAAALAMFFILAYTNVRHELAPSSATVGASTDRMSGITQQGASIFSAKTLAIVFGQDSPYNTVYIIENTTIKNVHPFSGFVLFLTLPIPRVFWADKPQGLGIILQQEMNSPANLAPGIIGHGWFEGLIPGVIWYAAFFGLFVGFMDRIIRERSYNPYFLVAVGCGLGNIVGLPRGETFLFFAGCFATFCAITFTFWFLAAIFGPIMRGTPAIVFDPALDPSAYDPDADPAYDPSEYDPAAEAEHALLDAHDYPPTDAIPHS